MSLKSLLNDLASFEPTSLPVVSLYLNAPHDDQGRDYLESYLRREFNAQLKTFAAHSPERMSLERDIEQINHYVKKKLHPTTNAVAIFACAGANDFWHAVQLDAPIAEHQLYVYHQPHLYPLARINDQYPRYVALVLDTNAARLFVFGSGERIAKEYVQNTKTSHTDVGGWSQARYQRHNENYHLQHVKEVVDMLDRVVRDDDIQHIILAGDEVIVPLIRSELPQHLAERVVDTVRLDMSAPEHEVFQATLQALQEHDAQDDKEKVAQLFEAYRAGGGGLGVVGVRDTLVALNNGQVDELIISANPRLIQQSTPEIERAVAAYAPAEETSAGAASTLDIAGELVTKAHQTSATVTFIEDGALLEAVEGVGALLRYRL
jgi:peptide subunit release factor 1 (eRF1)